MIIKNIYDEKITICGIGIDVDKSRPLDDFGTVTNRRNNINEFMSGLINKVIVLCYSNGIKITNNAIVIDILLGIGTHSNIDQDDQYYFVKDKFKLSSRNKTVTKAFLGNVDSLYILPSADIYVQISSGQGLNLIKEKVKRHQTIEYDFGGKMKNMIVTVTRDRSSTDVEIYIDGYSNKTTEELQNFIDGWVE